MQDLKPLLQAYKISGAEYEQIKKILKKEPTELELEIFSALWSEHCSYKSSKKYISTFPTSGAQVLQGVGANAGAIDLGDGLAAVFKIESHNHPSFIAPFDGAATGVGGILRDVLALGAHPVALMNSIKFGEIEGQSKTQKANRQLLKETARGIGFYGNCAGVATLAGSTSFEPCYDKNNIVNVFALGLADKNKLYKAAFSGDGNAIIYAGNKTGRGGLGGAVMSSAGFTENAQESTQENAKPAVPSGDPFKGKLLIDACTELFAHDYLTGITDMGAAGLAAAAIEMAANGLCGARLDLDAVPVNAPSMTLAEIMLSETQERMLLCAKSGAESAVLEIFRKRGLEAEIIGRVVAGNANGDGSLDLELYSRGAQIARLPALEIKNQTPEPDRPLKKPAYLEKIGKGGAGDFKSVSPGDAFARLISCAEVADKDWIYSQFDSTIGSCALSKAGQGAAGLMRLKRGGAKVLAISISGNARYSYANPKQGAQAAVCSACAGLVASGAKPLGITDCLNFGSPEDAEVMWQFKETCDGLKEACEVLGLPVVSGNVSFYNQTNGANIYPTPVIAAVGVVDDAKKIIAGHFMANGNAVYFAGNTYGDFGGSLFAKIFARGVGANGGAGASTGALPSLDLTEERRLQEFIKTANDKAIIRSARALGLGGLAITLAKMAAIANLGFEGMLTLGDENELFNESFSRAVFEVAPGDEEIFEGLLGKSGLNYQKIGKVTNEGFVLNSISVSSAQLQDLYFGSFKKIMDGE
ncbi:MAG: phosphoribosylformylglycinamidine synthase subunit PurL [Helicobacteraceae bacterium]